MHLKQNKKNLQNTKLILIALTNFIKIIMFFALFPVVIILRFNVYYYLLL